MDKIKERMAHLRAEADAAVDRAEAAEAKVKQQDLLLTQKEQEIVSLQNRLRMQEESFEKLEERTASLKTENESRGAGQANAESLTKKCQMLEDELDQMERTTKEKLARFNELEIRCEDLERRQARTEQERDGWEAKYEQAKEKEKAAQKELDDLVRSMEGL